MDRGTTEKKGKGKKARKLYPHGMNKFFCIPCDGNSICVHEKQKSACKECEGSAFCDHEKNKYRCEECGGSGICAHGNRKDRCKECSGNMLCKIPHCLIRKNPKCDGHCLFCFVNLFPDKPVARNYKTKENTVAPFLEEKFPDVIRKCVKRVENGCSRIGDGNSHHDC